MKKTSRFLLVLFVGFIMTSFSTKFAPEIGVRVIVIDAGHGGKDPGCHGKKYKEKDVALAVALKMGQYIKENLKDVKVVYTRKTDVFVELQERANIANKANADLFISIHCNAACYRSKKTKKDVCKDHVNGTETYVMGIKNEKGNLNVAKRENSAILLEDDYVTKYEGFDPNSDESYIIMSMFSKLNLEKSLNFAAKVQRQYRERVGRTDRGVKRGSLWVLWRTSMPSVLTEIGYLTNPDEEKFLGSKKGQDYIASGLFRAFKEYKYELEGLINPKEVEEIPVKEAKPLIKDTIIEENKMASKPPKPAVDTPVLVVSPVKNVVEVKADTSTKPSGTEGLEKILSGVRAMQTTGITDTSKKESISLEKVDKEVSPIIYKVQFLSSGKKIALSSDLFKDISNVGEYSVNGVFKYTSGEFSNLGEAVKARNILRQNNFKDAFVIAMQNGKRIPIK